MTLKGVMIIELTDENTGAVETVTEENMITESVNNILGLNPMGIFYAATGEYDAGRFFSGASPKPLFGRIHHSTASSAPGHFTRY